jgi:hypothetical protein
LEEGETLSDRSQPPRLSSCSIGALIGISLSAVVSCLLLLTPTFVTLTLNVLFFIPSRLGLIDPVRPEERITIHMPGERDIELSRDGKYDVFSTYLIPPTYEIVLTSWTTGERVAVWPYAEEDAKATDPVFEFEIEEPGPHHLAVRYPEGQEPLENYLTLVPDIPNQEILALLFGGIQVAAVAFVGWVVFRRIRRARVGAGVKAQRERHSQWRAGREGGG